MIGHGGAPPEPEPRPSRFRGCLVPALFGIALVAVLPLGAPRALVLIGLLVYLFAGLLAVRAVRRREGSGWWKRRPNRPSQWRWALLFLLHHLFALSTATLALLALHRLAPDAASDLLRALEDPGEAMPELYAWIWLLIAVLIGPVVEELLFRKLLLDHWIRRMGTSRAILAQAALFGIVHLWFPASFVFGVLAALIYLHTGSILVPIAMHMLNNAVPYLMGATSGDSDTSTSLAELQQSLTPAVFAALASMAAILWVCVRLWPRDNGMKRRA